MNNEKIAEQIISSMGSQLDLIFTLSVAICGGIVALTVQIVLNKEKNKRSLLKPCSQIFVIILLLLVFISEGLSVLFGYLSRSAITSAIPTIINLDFNDILRWEYADFDGYDRLCNLFLLQFYTFFSGIVILAFIVSILLFKYRKNI